MNPTNLTTALAEAQRAGRARPYPLELRCQAAAFAWRRGDAGAPLERTARQLGVSPQSLSRWMRDLGRGPDRGADETLAVVVPRPVVALPASPSLAPTDSSPPQQTLTPFAERSALLMRLPGGATVEGLDAATLAAVLRAL